MAFTVYSTKLVQNLVNCFFVGRFYGAAESGFKSEAPSISCIFSILKVGTQFAYFELSAPQGCWGLV